MACPNCNSTSVECTQEIYDPMKHHEEYICNVCGCVFAWDSVQTILEDPEETQVSPLQRTPIVFQEEVDEEDEEEQT